jgi:alpha-1,6-mannosyltransferase
MKLVLATGFLGSGLLAVGGLGVGSPPDRYDVPLALPMCTLGLLLLLIAWWLLHSASSRQILVATGLWSLPLLVAPPLFSRDVYLYAGQAQLVVAGVDPYEHGPSAMPGPLADEVDPVWRELPALYGPVFLRLASLVVRMTGERPLLAAYGLRFLEVVGLVLVAWALLRLSSSRRTLWLGLANPLLLLHGIAGAHNDLLMMGLVLSGLASPLAVGAVLITLAALIKAPALVALAFLPLLGQGRMRSYVIVITVAAATGVLATLATGLGWGWTSNLDGGNSLKSLLSVSTGFGVLVRSVSLGHAVGLVLSALAAAVLLLLATRREVPPLEVLRALGWAFLAIAVLSPVVQPWYLLWGVLVLAPVVSRRTAVGLAAGCAAMCLLVLPSGRHVIRPPLYGVPMVAVVAVAVVAGKRCTQNAGREASSHGDSMLRT